MKNVLELLQKRGFIDQMTSEELMTQVARPIRLYLGFDPTADSLHLGSLVGIVALKWFQMHGHTCIALVGGATGRIGDPSGKSVERPLLDESALESNVASLKKYLSHILPGIEIVNNQDWLGSFSLIEFLRDVGKYFRVGTMLSKESVRLRMESEEGLSFTEFTYQILQGYDFYHLGKNRSVSLQLGGSDQWGNIIAGIEFNRKMGGAALYGLTFPLLTRSDGKKFGKTEGGTVWLSPDRLSPYHFYQYLFRVPDADVIRLLKMLTFLDLAEIDSIESEMKREGSIPNQAQKRLAEEVTRFVHGEAGLQSALKVTEGASPGSEVTLTLESLNQLALEMGCVDLTLNEIIGQKFSDLATRVGLSPSKSEVVRLIKNGGAYLNNERVFDPQLLIKKDQLIEGKYIVVSFGKKKRVLVRLI